MMFYILYYTTIILYMYPLFIMRIMTFMQAQSERCLSPWIYLSVGIGTGGAGRSST